MSGRVRLGAVGYLNARPLVFGLVQDPRFDVRYDVPSECARLLHAHEIDVGLIPSIEYLRGPQPYAFVPGPAVTSSGPVDSVALYTRREPRDIRTVAMDSSSRTSVALVTILMRRMLQIEIIGTPMAPKLDALLDRAAAGVQKIDLGAAWTLTTGLPFVYALWVGWPDAVSPEDAASLQRARDAGVANVDAIAATHCPGDVERQAVVRRYLRDNIRCFLGCEEVEGLKMFYRYAAELGLASFDGDLRFYDAEHDGSR